MCISNCRKGHLYIFAVIKKLFQNSVSIDFVTVSDELEKQIPELPRCEIARTSIDTNGKIIITVTFGNFKYNKGEYPTGSGGFGDRQKLPYGKVFNLPALNESDGAVVNSMEFKNGVVVLKLDAATGNVAEVDYSFSYVSDITSAKTEGSDLVMRTVTNTNTNENYIVG